MKQRFSQLIEELSQELDTDLSIDNLNACSILFDEKFHVQIELDQYKRQIFIACIIATISPGKFREKVLSAALKANDVYPRGGTCAYNISTSDFIFFDCLPLEDLTGKKISDHLGVFIETVGKWKQAIDSGDLIPLGGSNQTQNNDKPFNLKK